MSLAVGDKAPDFTLPSTLGDVSLSETLKLGPAVIAFYVRDNTSG